MEALLGEGGLVEKYGAELARDLVDVFLVRRVGVDSDVQIRERKNLTGISYDVDETDVVTRIMPTGEDAGWQYPLPARAVHRQPQNIGAYTHPKLDPPCGVGSERGGGRRELQVPDRLL